MDRDGRAQHVPTADRPTFIPQHSIRDAEGLAASPTGCARDWQLLRFEKREVLSFINQLASTEELENILHRLYVIDVPFEDESQC